MVGDRHLRPRQVIIAEHFLATLGKTGGAGFAALDAITGDQLQEPPSPPKQEKTDGQNGSETKPWVPSKEVLTSRDNKTIGISRGDMRAIFMGTPSTFLRIFSHVR